MNNPGRRGGGGPGCTLAFRLRKYTRYDFAIVWSCDKRRWGSQFVSLPSERLDGRPASSAGRGAERGGQPRTRPLSNRIHKQGNGGVGEQDSLRASYLAIVFLIFDPVSNF